MFAIVCSDAEQLSDKGTVLVSVVCIWYCVNIGNII